MGDSSFGDVRELQGHFMSLMYQGASGQQKLKPGQLSKTSEVVLSMTQNVPDGQNFKLFLRTSYSMSLNLVKRLKDRGSLPCRNCAHESPEGNVSYQADSSLGKYTPAPKHVYRRKIPAPCELRLNHVGHLPEVSAKRGRCKHIDVEVNSATFIIYLYIHVQLEIKMSGKHAYAIEIYDSEEEFNIIFERVVNGEQPDVPDVQEKTPPRNFARFLPRLKCTSTPFLRRRTRRRGNEASLWLPDGEPKRHSLHGFLINTPMEDEELLSTPVLKWITPGDILKNMTFEGKSLINKMKEFFNSNQVALWLHETDVPDVKCHARKGPHYHVDTFPETTELDSMAGSKATKLNPALLERSSTLEWRKTSTH
ncbi:hypothetical protein RRG08_012371 [Elysia crispata]|uniref:Uncharacterized protein n=1 Tax=Elysia crispata TaxID=231223 RepID=A0AAE0ZQQ3_9GAST|nr:hypothetical protein RRG08_012371 [Elysia crispata]